MTCSLRAETETTTSLDDVTISDRRLAYVCEPRNQISFLSIVKAIAKSAGVVLRWDRGEGTCHPDSLVPSPLFQKQHGKCRLT